MNASHAFHPLARALHWLMALLILTMLFVGVGMVSTVSARHGWLLSLHRPLGAAIFVLAIIRLCVRLRFPPPPLPADMPAWQRFVAHASHWVLYGLMLAMPLIGWAMLSAGGYPVTMVGSWHLPPLMAPNGVAFAWLRNLHGTLAYLFFLTILGHVGAALYHGLIRRDDVLPSMTFPSMYQPPTAPMQPERVDDAAPPAAEPPRP